MNTFEMFDIVREVMAEHGMPDTYITLFPSRIIPHAQIIYTYSDDTEIPELFWVVDERTGERTAELWADGLAITVIAPAESLWKGRDVTAAPSPNDTPKTYTYPEGDAA